MAKGSLRVNGIIVDTDGEIKASTGDSIVIREDDGSAVITVDTNGKTSIGGPMDVGVDDTGHDVKFFGATAGAYMLWDESADDLIIMGGNVGIGTTAPATIDGWGNVLEIYSANGADLILNHSDASTTQGLGQITFARDNATLASINGVTGSTTAKGYLNFRTNDGTGNATKMMIGEDGYVGIGTTTLTDAGVTITSSVTRDANWDAKLALQSTGTSDWPTLLFSGCSATNRYGAIVNTASTSGNDANQITATIEFLNSSATAGNIVFRTNNNVGSGTASERMRIASDGNVGIGTTAPVTALAVQKAEDTVYANVAPNSADALLVLANIQASETTGDQAQIQFNVMGGSQNRVGSIGLIAESDSNRKGALVFCNDDGTSSGRPERMRITGDGNVGIGTTAPGTTTDNRVNLQVGIGGTVIGRTDDTQLFISSNLTYNSGWKYIQSTTASQLELGTDISLYTVASGTAGTAATLSEVVTVKANGNVGIGQTNPTTDLVVHNSGNNSSSIYITNDGDGTSATYSSLWLAHNYTSSADWAGITWSASENLLRILNAGNANTNHIVITEVGRVGIGEASPGYTLSVNGGVGVAGSNGGYNVIQGNFTGHSLNELLVRAHFDDLALQGGYNDSNPRDIRFYIGDTLMVEINSAYGDIWPGTDNARDLGISTRRFDDIYATNGTIQTSDINEKQDIEELSEAEQRVAVVAKGLLRKYRWKSAVEKKGDDARIHFGIIAQNLKSAFEEEGLDAGRYGMFIRSEWWESEDNIYHKEEEAPEGAVKKERLGIRYSELLAFIVSAI